MVAIEQAPPHPFAGRFGTAEERQLELLRCRDPAGFRYWVSQYVKIEDQIGGVIPFTIWPCHAQAIEALREHRFVVILKARQIGMSWLLGAAYPLWLCIFNPNKLCMLFSRRDDEAFELIRKCRLVWSRLPAWMKPALSKDNEGALEFEGLESRILAFPSNPDAGSSYSATYALADEHAKQPAAREQFAAIRPTIDMGGQFVSCSTARGAGNFYHQLWRDAQKGENGFHPIFFGYNERPGRDEQWWESTRATWTGSESSFYSEYPRTPEEAFQSSVPRRFDPRYLQDVTASCTVPLTASDNLDLAELLKLRAVRGALGFRVYQEPDAERQYVIGVDVAGGQETGDYHAAVVLDRAAGEEVALLHGRWPIPHFYQYVHRLAQAYHAHPLAVERNNQGHSLLVLLEQLRLQLRSQRQSITYQLYYERPVLDRQGHVARPGLPGWFTSKRTRPLMIDSLEEGFMVGDIRLATPAILDEAKSMTTFPDGTVGAERGSYDDLVMATALAWQMVLRNPTPQPRPRVPYVAGQHTERLRANFERQEKLREKKSRIIPFGSTKRTSLLQRLNRRYAGRAAAAAVG